nr:ribonuclease H-like domain-containing protein [Tanacetum cinerariifolium]
MESLNPQVVAAAKLPILNPNEFDIWKMRIEQYFLMTYYSLWEMIMNGDSLSPTRTVDGVVQIVAPTIAEQRLAKKNKLKAKGTLLISLLDKHQLKFNIHKDAKSLMEAIENRFGGNKETKKVQKTLLKQQYENFSGTSSESLNQIHDRLQKLISQLEILGETISQEDINLKFLRSLPSDFKIYEAEVKGSPPSSQNTQNIAFVSSNNTDSTNESITTASSITVASSKALVSTLLNKINPDDLEEMNLKWQMAMLTMRAKRFLKRTGRNLGANGTDTIGNKDTPRRTVPVEVSTSNALVSQCSSSSSRSDNEVAPCSKAYSKAYATLQTHYDNLIVEFRKSQFDVLLYKTESKVSDKTGLGFDNQVFSSQMFDCEELHSHESDNSVPKSPENDRYKTGEGYHAVPPPYTGTFLPPKHDLVFHDDVNANFKEINRGYVTFGGNPIGGKILGKGKIKTAKLDFDDVYFVKELKFNLFSVSKIYDKKNSVLFTDTECVVLSYDYKLPDENHVLLRVPRENNMYTVDLKNIFPSGDLTCLFAKATLDESNVWHRRLGHIKFKTINKLVKGNLVRGLPLKIFENNHTCVACQKGKQHRASCKSKPDSSVSHPLQSKELGSPKQTALGKDISNPFMAGSLPKTIW